MKRFVSVESVVQLLICRILHQLHKIPNLIGSRYTTFKEIQVFKTITIILPNLTVV